MAKLDISLYDQAGITTLRLGGSLDETTAPELAPTIDTLVEQRHPRVEVDLAGLDIIDSPGVAALVGLYKRIRAEGGEVEVINARDQPLAILQLLRMDEVFLR